MQVILVSLFAEGIYFFTTYLSNKWQYVFVAAQRTIAKAIVFLSFSFESLIDKLSGAKVLHWGDS